MIKLIEIIIVLLLDLILYRYKLYIIYCHSFFKFFSFKYCKKYFFFISDNIKVKIVTSKDGFDKMGKGKNANLLSDEQATDFKDLLLGFLVRFLFKIVPS